MRFSTVTAKWATIGFAHLIVGIAQYFAPTTYPPTSASFTPEQHYLMQLSTMDPTGGTTGGRASHP
jgi:hypothetical protein